MLDIFCPNCEALILDRDSCPQCGWRRPAATGGAVGDEVWRSDLRTKLNKPYCYPAVAASLYCLGTEDGNVLALDVESGEVVWEYQLDAGVLAHALATDGTSLFVGCEDVNPIARPGRALMAMDVATGTVRWQSPTEAHSLSAATAEGGRVFFTATDGYLRCVEASSGQLTWSVPYVQWGPTPPLAREGVVGVGGRKPVLTAYDAETGDLKWEQQSDDWFAYPLVADATMFYALAWDGRLYALNLETGALHWEKKGERGQGFTTPPAVAEETIFLGSRVYHVEEGNKTPGYALVALNATDGGERWRFYTGKHILTPPTATGGHVFFGDNDGSLYALQSDTGQLVWQMQVTSRAVTQPQVAGDLVLYGGRDGIIHAIRWRKAPVETVESPESYLTNQAYENAAKAYALGRDLVSAAQLYVEELGDLTKAIKLLLHAEHFDRAAMLYLRLKQPKEAAPLFEKAGDQTRAAQAWEMAGDFPRAQSLYQALDDKVGLARVTELAGDNLGAARIYQELENYEEAARLYHREGDTLNEAEMYAKLGQRRKAVELWRSADKWERVAKALSEEGDYAGAARIFEEHDKPKQAVNMYEQAGAVEDALRIHQTLQNWDKVAALAETQEDYALAGEAWSKVQSYERAAKAFFDAGKRAIQASPVNDGYVADLYERACELYRDHVFEDDQARICQRMVKRYRHLPELVVNLTSQKGLVVDQFNQLRVEIKNEGWGTAHDIQVDIEGGFDLEGDNTIRGLRPNQLRTLLLAVRPRHDYHGDVRFQLKVTYQDNQNDSHILTQQKFLEVKSGALLDGLLSASTPLNINIQELYQNSRKVGGDYMEGGAQKAHGDIMEEGSQKAQGDILNDDAQKGDRVEVQRSSGAAAGRGSEPHVAVREGVGPVRRCTICNLPTSDPTAHYCLDCGAPLPEPTETADSGSKAASTEQHAETEMR